MWAYAKKEIKFLRKFLNVREDRKEGPIRRPTVGIFMDCKGMLFILLPSISPHYEDKQRDR